MRIPNDFEIALAIAKFNASHRGVMDDAYCAFVETVDPRPMCIGTIPAAFNDYFLFDYEYEDGRTIARDMAAEDPELFEWATAKYTRLVPEVFANGWQIFRDAFDGTPYPMRDPIIAERPNWDTGSLGCRVAYDGHDWVLAGTAHLHDQADFDPETYPERVSFIEDYSKVVGGGYRFISSSIVSA